MLEIIFPFQCMSRRIRVSRSKHTSLSLNNNNHVIHETLFFKDSRGMRLWENVHLHDFCLFRTLVAKTSQDHWSCLEKTAYRALYSTRVLQLESLPLITQDFLPVSLFTLNLFYLLWPSRFYFVFFSWRVMSCNRSQNMQRLKSISNHLSVLCII